MYNELIEQLGERTKAANPPKEGDYIGDDGLLYCGICHTAKQADLRKYGFGIKFCACECERKRYDEQKAAEKKAAEEFERRIEADRRRQYSFEDDFYKPMTFAADNGKSPEAIKAAHYYVDNFESLKAGNKGLMFLGKCGTGKTFAACCIANALLDKQYSVWVSTVTKLIRIVGNFQTSEEALYKVGNVDLLILDDFGVQSRSEYSTQTLFDIIDERYRSAKPLIITSNLAFKEFIEPRDNINMERIYDRIKEMCLCPISPVLLNGESLRVGISRDKRLSIMANITNTKHFEKAVNV